MKNLIKVKVDISFYYYYFSMLTFIDSPNTYSDEFLILHNKHRDDIFKLLTPSNVTDEPYAKKIVELIKFIDFERNQGKTMYIIRNLLVTEKNDDILFLSNHEFLREKHFERVDDFRFFVQSKQLNREFVKMLRDYIKNILAMKYINTLTDTLLDNITEDTNIKNITNITRKFEEILHNYLVDGDALTFEQVTIEPETEKEILKELIDNKVSKIFNIETIPTKFSILDNFIGGGLQKGRVYLVLGKTGQGKSSFIIHLTKNFLEQGKKILFYTFENSVEETLERLFACITQIPMSQFRKPEYKDILSDKVSEFFTQYKGKINVVFSPAETINPEMIKEKIKTMGNEVDIIIVDYLDLLKYKKNVEERIRTMRLVRQLKNLAQETNTIVITPSQVHRGVYRSKIVEVDNVSESFGKISESDGVFILETSPEEIQQNIIRLNVGKLRHGKSGIRIEMIVNFDTMTFVETGNIVSSSELKEDDEEDMDTKKSYKKKRKDYYVDNNETEEIIF